MIMIMMIIIIIIIINNDNHDNNNDKIVCKVILCFWANGCHIAAATKLPLKSSLSRLTPKEQIAAATKLPPKDSFTFPLPPTHHHPSSKMEAEIKEQIPGIDQVISEYASVSPMYLYTYLPIYLLHMLLQIWINARIDVE